MLSCSSTRATEAIPSIAEVETDAETPSWEV